ncbi:MAG: UbiA family prenyltransferase [Gemmataceae bacterium]
MTKYPRLLAYAQLLRLPNVFTAFADICLGACAAGYVFERPGAFLGVLLASGCLYLCGMAWNDFFDRADDARTQPFRPIPSGRITPRTAFAVGVGLFAAGVSVAAVVGIAGGRMDLAGPGAVAVTLANLVLGYDAFLKRTPLGPVAMGLCRALNVLLGLSAATLPAPPALALHLAAVVCVYIVGVTWFARTEETDSNRRQLAFAAVVMLLAAVGGLLVPVHRPEGATPVYFPYLLVAAGFWVGTPVVRAIRRPEPKLVQAAVKRCIFGLVALDAVLATAFVGWPGLLILLLLLPATYLGRWVYST